MKPRRLIAVACAAIFATGASAANLTVFAAASLSDALMKIAPAYTKATGDTLRFNLGASGTLARQIEEGAPADIFISADERTIDRLEKAGALMPGTRQTILANQLVVVVAAKNGAPVAALGDLAKPLVRRIAIGEPATVPAGMYAKEVLEKRGLWAQVSAKTVPLDNVRAVLAVVESGDADAGFVYRTDARISKKVRIAVSVPRSAGPKITYPVAVVRYTKTPEEAKAFAAFLAGPEARKVFAKFGFVPTD